MIKRIENLTQKVLSGDTWFQTEPTEYDREDIFLSHTARTAREVSAYILNQRPQIDENAALTGYIRFDDDRVEGEIFHRVGHRNFQELMRSFYMQPLDNLLTLEWQHSSADYGKVLQKGIEGLQEEILEARKQYTDPDRVEFLDGLETVAGAILGWVEKCADHAADLAAAADDQETKFRLTRMSETLRRVPRKPAATFFEAVQVIYVIFSFVPDSIGTIDRYLYPYYKKDMDTHTLTREEARSYLQELFLMLQAATAVTNSNSTRGAESTFCIGGYLPNGEDGFTDLSRLVIEALMELPTCIPQVLLRWTEKTPDEVLRFMMDCERKDPNKRIAFVNDEPRIQALTKNAGLSYADAVSYTMAGCNQLVLPGGIDMGTAVENALHSVVNLFHNRGEELIQAETFEDFYALYQEELWRDLDKIVKYENLFNSVRARDIDIVSSLFFNGCIQNARSVTRGGSRMCLAQLDVIGVTNVIDSLTVVRQFVYDEKRISMQELTDALKCNWKGYEELRLSIEKKAEYFGNDSEISNEMARRFTTSIYEYLKDKKNIFGYRFLMGNLIGYHQHNKWFGNLTKATPDGRYDGDILSFGIGQTNGRDREGLTALLNSVAQYDPCRIMCGPSVTNILMDERMIRDDANFEKTVLMMRTYLKKGGLQYQLNYVSADELRKAKENPAAYKNLRVRVSGFSDYFNNLNDDLKNEIIARTEHSC